MWFWHIGKTAVGSQSFALEYFGGTADLKLVVNHRAGSEGHSISQHNRQPQMFLLCPRAVALMGILKIVSTPTTAHHQMKHVLYLMKAIRLSTNLSVTVISEAIFECTTSTTMQYTLFIIHSITKINIPIWSQKFFFLSGFTIMTLVKPPDNIYHCLYFSTIGYETIVELTFTIYAW